MNVITYNSIRNNIQSFGNLTQGLGNYADGNMLSDGTLSYSWDGENRLIELDEGVGVFGLFASYSYDYANRRYNSEYLGTGKLGALIDQSFDYIYNGTKVILRREEGNISDSLKSYAWHQALGHPDSIAWSSEEFYGCGLNKNVYAKYNQSGTKIKSYDYDAFGNIVLESPAESTLAINNDFLFSSEYTDNWGLVHYLYRTYNPAQRRFLQEDPIQEEGGINLYNFTMNNPVTNWDKLGLTSYTFSCCSEEQQEVIKKAAKEAIRLSEKAKGWLEPPKSDKKNKVTFRYKKYFGEYQKERLAFVKNTYTETVRILKNSKVEFICSSCTEEDLKDTYAYVYQGDGKYSITTCPLFFTASTVGYNCQSGIIIHEIVHEVDDQIIDQEVAGKDPYSLSSVLFYAKHYPWTAITNAQNYSYFTKELQ